MRTVTALMRSALALLALAVTAVTVQATAPAKPIEFSARVIENSTPGTAGATVKLSWLANQDGDAPTSFDVYMAVGETEDETQFSKIGSVEVTPTMPPNNYMFWYAAEKLQPGTYTFFVKAVNADGESPRSVIRVVVIKDPSVPRIEIASQPANVGSIGQPYTYRAKLYKNFDGGQISWLIVNGTDGMTISEEGVVSWPEPRAGRYEINIKVTVEINGITLAADQSWVLEIKKGDDKPSKCVSISGTVKFDNANRVVMRGNVIAWRIDSVTNDHGEDSVTNEHGEDSVTNEHGEDSVTNEHGEDSVTNEHGEDSVTIDHDKDSVTNEHGEDSVTIDHDKDSVTNEHGEDSVANGHGEDVEKMHAISKAEIQQGEYHMAVRAGSYKIRVEGEGFFAEWYQDVTELVDAQTITVTCDTPQVEINFVVTARPEPVKYVVSGRVYDAETNQGIANALVVFEARKHDNSTSAGLTTVFKAETNVEGYYEVKLPEGMLFTGKAMVRDERGGDHSEYIQEWWKESHDATQATVIEIIGNIDGINFSMDKRLVYNNGFSGNLVDDETGKGVTGKVTAFMLVGARDPAGKDHKTLVVSVETDDQGNFTFTNLEPGDYIVFGIPGLHPYVPGWYVVGAKASHSWKEATVISVGDVMMTLQHTIRLEKANDSLGRGRVRGWVYDRRGGIIGKNVDHVENTNGIVGSLVVAIDAKGNVVDYDLSGNEGAYELSELGFGRYTLFVDRLGYESATESVTINNKNLDVPLSIGLIQQVTSVEVPTGQIGTSYNLFPNPANAAATLRFPSSEGTAQISMISMSGVVLSTQNIDVAGGETSLVLNVGAIPTGIVLVRVSNGTRTFALPLQIVR